MSNQICEPRIVEESSVDSSLDQRLRDLLVGCFPKDAATFSRSRGWHGSQPVFNVLLEDEVGELIAHASVVDRTVSVAGSHIRIAGLQNVCVRTDRRGGRLIDRIMTAAIVEARRREFEGGLLFCVHALCPAYGRTGWQPLDRLTLIKRDPDGRESVQTTDEAMFLPLSRPAFPAGDVYLNGNDW